MIMIVSLKIQVWPIGTQGSVNEKIFILPSFGIVTGGLDINSKEISDVLGKKNLNIYPVGLDKVYKL